MCVTVGDMVPERIVQALDFMFQNGFDSDEWMKLKYQLIRMIPWQLREKFTRKTAENGYLPVPNELEYEIMKLWANKTGRSVLFSNDGQDGKIDPQ